MKKVTTPSSKNQISGISDYELEQIVNRDEILKIVRNYIQHASNSFVRNVIKKLLSNPSPNFDLKNIKGYSDLIFSKNDSVVEKEEDDEEKKLYIKENVYNKIRKKVFNLLPDINSSITQADTENNDKWAKRQKNGMDVYEVNKHCRFQDIREKIDKEGKNVNFRYSFKEPDLKVSPFENTMSLQMVDVHINDNGETFGFPLSYIYICPKCGYRMEKKEYEVASTNRRIKCENFIEKKSGKPGSMKKCKEPLSPDINRTKTKQSYIYNVTFKDKDGQTKKADAISFLPLPKGNLRVVLQKISRPYGRPLVHIVDYKPIDKRQIPVPERKDDEHYIFTLIKTIDEYIEKTTGYKHYGYLPMKLAMILQFGARYIPTFRNVFNIALTGTMSSGKSYFARYWGYALYSQDCWKSNATSISIPKLRGTMEDFKLFDKNYRYQYKGLLGEKDLIVIDEVKESPQLKNNLKQYGLEPTYEYSKQGGNNQIYERTAHLVVTQNIDTKHLDEYAKRIKKVYQDDNLRFANEDESEPKPSWDSDIDLTLPLYEYDNRYLRYSIKKIRNEYTRNQINWIDGSELALKQRFYFYFFLESNKTNEKLDKVIRENTTKNVVDTEVEIMRLMDSRNLVKKFQNFDNLEGENDVKYFRKIDDMLKDYGKRTDARTKRMSYAIIKLLRIIDGRKKCKKQDLKIFQYILESLDNKMEVADTNKFEIDGPHNIEEEQQKIEEGNDEQDWGYSSDMDSFNG